MKQLSLVLVLWGCLQSCVATDIQVDALHEMRKQLADSRGVLERWKNNQMSPCYWVNINCQNNSVISITLSSCGLSGVLSPSIAKLTTLQHLLLDDNSITGEIPEEFGNLSSLRTLKLGQNRLNGSIPGSLGHLSNLENLDLSKNILSGNIPSSLSNLPWLNDINLADNNLSGEIPEQFFQVPEYNFTGNHLNCGQDFYSCDSGSTPTVFSGKKQTVCWVTSCIPSPTHGAGPPINPGIIASPPINPGTIAGPPMYPGIIAGPPMMLGRKRKLWIVATVLSLVAALTCFTLCFGWIRSQRKGKMKVCHRLKVNVHQDEELELGIEQGNSEFTIFDISLVFEATKEFSEENKLGQGGFGPVYKGQFTDGLEIAVKRLASRSGQGLREFKNEVQLIAKLQHRNLVRLLGCCSQGEEKMLVYEYLPNKSLDFFIFDETRRTLLSWSKRLVIIEGIAQGLLYLHKHSRLRVIHRDVKASNILLDSKMNPKISDFGLARMFSSDDTDGNTKRVVGTYGYMAPEYASEGLFSTKSDVFSFGVLILEIITGKRNSGFHQHEDFLNLLGYAWQLWGEGRWLELVDASLVSESRHVTSEVMRCINIALLCVQEAAADRPTMSDVVVMLISSGSMVLSEPKHPAYFHVRVGKEETSTVAELCSANDVTISSPRGR